VPMFRTAPGTIPPASFGFRMAAGHRMDTRVLEDELGEMMESSVGTNVGGRVDVKCDTLVPVLLDADTKTGHYGQGSGPGSLYLSRSYAPVETWMSVEAIHFDWVDVGDLPSEQNALVRASTERTRVAALSFYLRPTETHSFNVLSFIGAYRERQDTTEERVNSDQLLSYTCIVDLPPPYRYEKEGYLRREMAPELARIDYGQFVSYHGPSMSSRASRDDSSTLGRIWIMVDLAAMTLHPTIRAEIHTALAIVPHFPRAIAALVAQYVVGR
jgi:hypothetical protein